MQFSFPMTASFFTALDMMARSAIGGWQMMNIFEAL